MSKAERTTQQLRNHSTHHAQALSSNQLKSPGDNNRRGPSHSWPPLQGVTALTTTCPSQKRQGHHAQLLRCLLSPQSSDTAPKPGPFPCWGNSTTTACSAQNRAKKDPLQRTTKEPYAQFPSSPTFPGQGQ